MIRDIQIKILPDLINQKDKINHLIHEKLRVDRSRVRHIELRKKSIDARGSRPFYILRYDAFIDEDFQQEPPVAAQYKNVSSAIPVIIIGAGPAGYFAALECLITGLKPVILERGKDVQARRRDLKAIQQDGIVNPDSNYCFGEGGAGTYSDGKLYTRSHKRGNIEKVLRQLVEHGAIPDILTDAHPHIGSNKLPGIIAEIRKTILDYGGEIHFETEVTDFIISNNRMEGVKTKKGEIITAKYVVVATGHSSRGIFQIFANHQLQIEAKDFALGLRIEHPQSFIDYVQYRQSKREDGLPAASYSVVAQVENNGVFSFCMCPGGLVVPAATAPGEIVVNGMSISRRDSPFANSGFVTSISVAELEHHGYKGVFASLDFQRDVEKSMFEAGDGSQKAPAQRVRDFVDGKLSATLNPTSYIPGLIAAPLHNILPEFVYQRLRRGLIQIDKKMKGYVTNDANIIGVESRTSSPVKIPRDPETLMHKDAFGLFPCGEGAGYAGGILSAAMDGQKVIQAVRQVIAQEF